MVTAICAKTDMTMAAFEECTKTTNKVTVTPVPANLTSIIGTLTTRNIIMANWQKAMWQNVLNRALRMLASRPFGSHFFSAFGTINGN
ncbi:hypothetical protein KIN20_003068 [Parelaphostrongylus tenuis]|uniref:Uncharacterized protein n=1 Tax=Parelaphostrongylus tenuis TaxID=148309 RepID=A0AAD5M0S6_PARTN|nr:hypothetical protein KIN20_003068 [Parelaphostrongylus tenuis]